MKSYPLKPSKFSRPARLLVLSACGLLFVLGLLPGNLGAADGAGETVIAVVNKVPIKASELENVSREYIKKSRQDITPEVRRNLLQNLVRRQLILQQESVNTLRAEKSIVERVKAFEESLVIAKFLEDTVGKQVTISEDALRQYYEENRHKYASPPKVVSRHILLRTREEAEKVLARLQAGEDFGQLAKEFSIDLPKALEGGTMGTIEKGQDLLPELEKELFLLKVGEFSGIIPTKFGYHILTVDQIIPVEFKSFEEVNKEIKMTVLHQKEAKAFDEMATKLEEGAEITIFETQLSAMGR
jgi:parvulin-like peptidyl-prolyl isomerase